MQCISHSFSEASRSGTGGGKKTLRSTRTSAGRTSAGRTSAGRTSKTRISDKADLFRGNLGGAKLGRARLGEAILRNACLVKADCAHAHLVRADLSEADLRRANLSSAILSQASLHGAKLSGAKFHQAVLAGAFLSSAILRRAKLTNAILSGANFGGSDLSGANLTGANLTAALLLETKLEDTILNNCRVYGISAWNVKLSKDTRQQDLVITKEGEPEVTVDNIEVAQFVYLLLHNEKIRDVIDTVGKKGVLLLGRFTEGRIAVLERLREELRKRGYLPVVFNFDKPETKDFTETVRLLAGLSRFVIADVTNPKSAPLELQATVPEIMVPFLPIIEEGQEPFAMLTDLWIKHRDWVFEPIHYSSLDALVGALDKEIIGPAEVRSDELVVRRAEKMKGRHI